MINLRNIVDLENEIWVDIQGWEGYYMVSNQLRFKSLKRKSSFNKNLCDKLLKPFVPTKGYPNLKFYKQDFRKTYTVHRIIATAFVSNPKGKKYVNHKNGNKKDYRIENLEWCTFSENCQHAHDNNLSKMPISGLGEKNKLSKISNDQAIIIKTLLKEGKTPKFISTNYNISISIIRHIKFGDAWKWLHI